MLNFAVSKGRIVLSCIKNLAIMKKSNISSNWLLVSVIMDSFLYNNNRLTFSGILDFVTKWYNKHRVKLGFGDTTCLLSHLEDKGVIGSIWDDKHNVVYFRVDLENVPKVKY